MTAHLKKNWWLLTLRGVLLIIFGIFAMAAPEVVLFSFLIFIGVIALITGIILFLEGASIRGDSDRTYKITEGLISMVFALAVLIHPNHSLRVAIIILAFWVIAVGVFQIIAAVKLRKTIKNERFGILIGALTLFCGFFLLANLIEAAQTIIIIIGIYYIIVGLLMVLQSFRFKSLGTVL